MWLVTWSPGSTAEDCARAGRGGTGLAKTPPDAPLRSPSSPWCSAPPVPLGTPKPPSSAATLFLGRGPWGHWVRVEQGHTAPALPQSWNQSPAPSPSPSPSSSPSLSPSPFRVKHHALPPCSADALGASRGRVLGAAAAPTAEGVLSSWTAVLARPPGGRSSQGLCLSRGRRDRWPGSCPFPSTCPVGKAMQTFKQNSL